MCVDLTVVDLVIVTLRARFKTVTRGSLRALVFFLCVDGLLLASSSPGTETTAGISVLVDIRTSDGAPDAQYERSAYSVCLWSSVDSVELIFICGAGAVANFHRKIWNIYFLTHKSTYTRMSLQVSFYPNILSG